MAGLDRYQSEAWDHSQELLDLLRRRYWDQARALLDRHSLKALILGEHNVQERSLRLLSQTPAQRDQALARLDQDQAAKLVLQARYYALVACGAYRLAQDVSHVQGLSYRKATKQAALDATVPNLWPDKSDLLE